IEQAVAQTLPPVCRAPVRFMLEVEISTIYKKGDRTRKIHHLIYAPDFATVDRISDRLARIGNIASDGRPILGLDSRDLLEITLTSVPTPISSRRISGRRGSPRSARSPALIRSPPATAIWAITSLLSRPALLRP